ncbi:MAG: sulfatase-like hydrolase/transferase [Acidimicrobiales bacterium]
MSDADAGADEGSSGGVDDTASSKPSLAARVRPLIRPELYRFLELFALCGLAFAQPILDIYGRSADVFVNQHVDGILVVAFGLIIVAIPPLVLWLVTLPLRAISPTVETVVHRVILALLVGVFVVQATAQNLSLAAAYGLAVAATIGVGVALFRTEALQVWVRFLAIAPPLFLALFLFTSNVTPLVFQSGGSEAKQVTVDNPIPVVTLLFDELPLVSLLDGTGQVDATLYPNFAEVAKGSTFFRNYSAIAPNTTTVVPAIMTGVYPDKNAAPVAAEYPDNVYTLLGGTYDMRVQETLTELCSPELCARFGIDDASPWPLAGDAVGTWTDRFGKLETGAAGVKLDEFVTEADGYAFHDPIRFTDFIDELQPAGSRPTFNMLHSILPHFPWEILPTGKTYEDPNGLTPLGAVAFRWYNEYSADAARLRHLLQLQYTDAWLGQIIAKLKETGLWDDALIIVTADHGVGFMDGEPFRAVTTTNAYQVMWPPLFMQGPGFTPGAVSDRPVTSVDLLPTIADVVGVEIPWEVDGTSVLQPPADDGTQRLVKHTPLSDLPDDGSGWDKIDGPSNLAKVLASPRIGQGDDALRLFRIGSRPDLIGQTINDVELGPASNAFVRLHEGLTDPFPYDPDPRVPVQAQISGRGYGTNTRTIAIVLNGWIVGVMPFGPGGFWTLLPEAYMVPGDNVITAFLVDESTNPPTFKELRVEEGDVKASDSEVSDDGEGGGDGYTDGGQSEDQPADDQG